MQTLMQNFRFALRMLRRSPGLTVTVLLTLAMGIGANTAIFTVDYATLLAPLPYPQPDQLVMVWSKIQGSRNGVSAGDYLDWKRQSTVFQNLNAWSGTSFNVATKEQPEFIQATTSTVGSLRMMGDPLFLGRYFLPEEGTAGRDHVVILTHKLWAKLGANRNIIGTTLRLNGEPYTVVGVQQPGNHDKGDSQLTVPLVFKPDQINHDFHWLLVMGRLKPGWTLQRATAQLNAISPSVLEATVPPVYKPDSVKHYMEYKFAAFPADNGFSQLRQEYESPLWTLLVIAGLVLLIACANLANLMLARASARANETSPDPVDPIVMAIALARR